MHDMSDLLASLQSTDAAGDYDPLPAAVYAADVLKGELGESRSGKPVYKVTYAVVGGEHDGRRLFGDLYLTPAAMAYAVRDLSKLFGRRPTADDLQAPFPPGVRCRVRVERRTSDSGAVFNRSQLIGVVGRDVEPAPYTPTAMTGGQ